MSVITKQNLDSVITVIDEMLLKAFSENYLSHNLVFHFPYYVLLQWGMQFDDVLIYKDIPIIESDDFQHRILLYHTKGNRNIELASIVAV